MTGPHMRFTYTIHLYTDKMCCWHGVAEIKCHKFSFSCHVTVNKTAALEPGTHWRWNWQAAGCWTAFERCRPSSCLAVKSGLFKASLFEWISARPYRQSRCHPTDFRPKFQTTLGKSGRTWMTGEQVTSYVYVGKGTQTAWYQRHHLIRCVRR